MVEISRQADGVDARYAAAVWRTRQALVIIDMQNDFVSDAGAFAQAGADVVRYRRLLPVLNGLSACARATGVPVVLVGMRHAPLAELLAKQGVPVTERGVSETEWDAPLVEQGVPVVERGVPVIEQGVSVVEQNAPVAEWDVSVSRVPAAPCEVSGPYVPLALGAWEVRRALTGHPDSCRTDWGCAFYEELLVAKEDLVVWKHRYSAFTETGFAELLRGMGVETLVLAGINTNTCVESTLRDAYMQDFHVVLVRDATIAARDDTYEPTLRNVERHFGLVTEAQVVMDNWKGERA